jgi:hypothetical protein
MPLPLQEEPALTQPPQVKVARLRPSRCHIRQKVRILKDWSNHRNPFGRNSRTQIVKWISCLGSGSRLDPVLPPDLAHSGHQVPQLLSRRPTRGLA